MEDFTEFEQRAAYFDGDPVIATKKGVNVLERGSQVHDMAEFQELLDFPPAPKLDVFGRLDPSLATAQERQGEQVFFGKGRCVQALARIVHGSLGLESVDAAGVVRKNGTLLGVR